MGDKTEKCKERFGPIVRNGWTLSLLCDLPKGHEGEHEDTSIDILVKDVLPEMERIYDPPLIG